MALTSARRSAVIALTAASCRVRRLARMEWMLQVVDELDDALGTFRHLLFSWRVEICVLAAAAAETAQREVRFTRREMI
jgi:hypothetical protein